MLGCAADNIRPVNIQSLRMLEKRIFIFAGNVHHRFMLFFRRQHHLVVTLVGITRQMPDISNIHGVFQRKTGPFDCFTQYVFKNIRAQIADMGIVVNRRTTTIHSDHSVRIRGNQGFNLAAVCIV